MINNTYRPAVETAAPGSSFKAPGAKITNKAVTASGKTGGRSNLAQAIDTRKAASETSVPANSSNPGDEAKPAAVTVNQLANILKFDNENLVRGIILSEVLGKPRCKRKGRW